MSSFKKNAPGTVQPNLFDVQVKYFGLETGEFLISLQALLLS